MTPQGRIAELELELDKALEERREWMEKVTVSRQRIAELECEALNVTNLKDLEYLMEIAAAHLNERSPFNSKWQERAKKYQQIFRERMIKAEEA